MDDNDRNMTALEHFAQYLGLSGADYDLFYEMYHELDEVEYDDLEYHWDGAYESIESY